MDLERIKEQLNENIFGTPESREKIEPFTADNEGEEVQGVMARSPSDLSVQITRPYVHLATGSHIMYLARPYRSFEGDYGDLRAREMLEELYRLGRYLDEHLEEIEALYRKKGQARRRHPTEDVQETFKQKRRRLRRELRDGDLTAVEYQQRLEALRGKREERGRRLDAMSFHFWETVLPEDLVHLAPDNLPAVLNGRSYRSDL